MAKKNSVELIRKGVLGIGILITVALITVYFVATRSPVADGALVEGTHYTRIDSPRKPRGTKPEVMEFFSYGCVHCFNFDPDLKDWVAGQKDSITFIQTPVVGGDYWRLLGQTYYTLLEMNLLETNHTRIFAEIHKNGRIFRSAEDVADWIDGKGTTAEAFLEAFNSTNVQRRVQFADALARQFQAASVPALVVNGKYMINVSRQVSTIQMLDIAERLIANDPDDASTATSGKPAGG